MIVYIINEGIYYNAHTTIHSIHFTKKCAEQTARQGGFRLNKKDHGGEMFFENESIQEYRTIDIQEINCEKCRRKK